MNTANDTSVMSTGTDVRMTLNYILDASRARFAERPAIGMAMEPPLSYTELHRRVLVVAAKLMHDGLKKGDRVAILAENSDRWGLAYFAIVRIGAIAVPILPDLPESDVHHILAEMQVKVIFASQRQLEKIHESRQASNGLVITLDDYRAAVEVAPMIGFSEFLQEAETLSAAAESHPEFPEVGEDDLASILYTSGTSGYSKAVMLSHKNLTSNAYSASSLMALSPEWNFLSILPMSHTYEFTTGFILPLLNGCRIAYAGKSPTPAILQKLCQHEQPSVIFAVPLVLEKIYKKRVQPQIEKSKLLSFCCRYSFSRRLIYRKIGAKLLAFFGGKLQLMGIGGAALNPEVEQFLTEANFPYLIGYGLTESSPLLAGGPFGDSTIMPGSTGKPIPGVEIRIAEADPVTGIGEIQAAGPNIMKGYFANPEATAQVLSADGWLSTGDLGCFDQQGNLHVKGRSKNVIVLSNGENVYPEPIEHKINTFPWVVESLVLENGDRLEAWIYPDYEQIDEHTTGRTPAERQQHIVHLLEELRAAINSQLSSSARLTRIVERREPFVKTATHKIKRYLYDSSAAIQ